MCHGASTTSLFHLVEFNARPSNTQCAVTSPSSGGYIAVPFSPPLLWILLFADFFYQSLYLWLSSDHPVFRVSSIYVHKCRITPLVPICPQNNQAVEHPPSTSILTQEQSLSLKVQSITFLRGCPSKSTFRLSSNHRSTPNNVNQLC